MEEWRFFFVEMIKRNLILKFLLGMLGLYFFFLFVYKDFSFNLAEVILGNNSKKNENGYSK